MRVRPLILTLILLFLPTTSYAASHVVLDCEVNMGQPPQSVRMQVYASPFTVGVRFPQLFNGLIPLNTHSLAFIKQGLRLTDEEFKKKFAGKRVLLIGEGFGELLPALKEIGADVVAVDPIYALRDIPDEKFDQERLNELPRARSILRNIREYITEHRLNLRPALAQRLPFMDQSFDYAISHFLVSNLFAPHYVGFNQNFENQKALIYRAVIDTLMESARVVAIGGQAFHVLTGKNAHDSFLGPEGLIREQFVGREKMMKRIWIEVSKGVSVPVEFSGNMDLQESMYRRAPTAEVSLLTIWRE